MLVGVCGGYNMYVVKEKPDIWLWWAAAGRIAKEMG